MAELIHLELNADFFNRIGQEQTWQGVHNPNVTTHSAAFS
jgi:hypothetical protein